MKFALKSVSRSSGRIGCLLHQQTEKSFQTPILIQCTKGGSIPHISNDIFSYVSNETPILLLSLSTITHMIEALKCFDKGASTFMGYKDSPNILVIRDVCEITPSGFNDKDIIPLFTKRGKECLSPEEYMKMVEIIRPDIYIGLCDADTNEESSKKRTQKSVDRTDSFFNYCYEKHESSRALSSCSLFAPIVGGYNKFARTLSIKNVKEKTGISGYVLEGFHSNGLSATKLNSQLLLDVVEHCINELDSDKPKLMMGAYSPLVVVKLVGLGIDIFDTSYAYIAAANFKALAFNFDLCKDIASTPFLDLSDDGFKEDFSPFLEGCLCTACKNHTKAYVHHLYNTKELLGPILLMIHNIHHYQEFFRQIRSAVEKDVLKDLIRLLEFQGTPEKVDYTIEKLLNKSCKMDNKRSMFTEMATTQTNKNK